TRSEVYRRVCVARDFIYSYYNTPIMLEDIARAASLSVPQLVRQFKAVFGQTPHAYLLKVRLSKARDLLKSTDDPVGHISLQCGFEDASAFSRAFKSEFGAQPGVLRRISARG